MVSGFHSMNSEIECQVILKHLEERGYKISLPDIVNKEMKFYTWKSGDPLVDGDYNTKIPDKMTQSIVIPDVILAPLLGFDMYCY